MIGCLYIASFPLWAFGRAQPEECAPVAVVSGGRVIAASAECRRAGIVLGMAAGRAAALLPDAALAARDRPLEEAAWEQALEEVNRLTPFMEDAGEGTAYFTGASPEEVQVLAERLGGRIGFARHRSFALLAALRAAPGRVMEVGGHQEKAFMARFGTARLVAAGFAEEFVEALQLFGYESLQQVGSLSERHLKGQFGDEGKRLFEMLHPGEEPPVPLFKPAPVIRAFYDFEHPATEPADLLPVLDALAHEAAGALGACHCRRIRLSLTVRGRPMPLYASRALPEPVCDGRRISQTVQMLLTERLEPDMETDAVAVELGALRVLDLRQQSLFTERPSVYEAVRVVHRKFPASLWRAVAVPSALLHEDEMRLEPYPETPPPRRRRTRAKVTS